MIRSSILIAVTIAASVFTSPKESVAGIFGHRGLCGRQNCFSQNCQANFGCESCESGECVQCREEVSSSPKGLPSPEVIQRLDTALTRLNTILEVLDKPNREGGVASESNISAAVKTLSDEVKNLKPAAPVK